MTPKERADHAKRLLADEVLSGAFADVRENIVRGVEASAFGDVDTHHHTALALHALQRVKSQLRKYLEAVVMEERAEQEKAFHQKLLKSIGFP